MVSDIHLVWQGKNHCTTMTYCSRAESNNQACGKIFTIHDVSARDTVKDIKRMIIDKVPNFSTLAGLCWNPPKGKQCMTLENDKDLEKAKREHAVKGEVKNLQSARYKQIGGKGRVVNRSMKRKLDLQALSSSVKPETIRSKSSEDSESEEEDRFVMYLKNKASKPDQKQKGGNSKCNDYHIELIRCFRKKGTKSRYSA